VFQTLLKKIASELHKRDIPYMIIGGQAVLLYGEPRLTKDIDVTLGIGIDGLQRIKSVVIALGLIYVIDNVEDFVRETMVLPVSEKQSGIRVDFLFSFSPYERQAIQRANEIKLGKTAIRFASLEDVIIHKIVAKRPRDIEDVRSVLLKNPDYDKEYIQKWLKEFDDSLGEGLLNLFNELVKKIEN